MRWRLGRLEAAWPKRWAPITTREELAATDSLSSVVASSRFARLSRVRSAQPQDVEHGKTPTLKKKPPTRLLVRQKRVGQKRRLVFFVSYLSPRLSSTRGGAGGSLYEVWPAHLRPVLAGRKTAGLHEPNRGAILRRDSLVSVALIDRKLLAPDAGTWARSGRDGGPVWCVAVAYFPLSTGRLYCE